jgi:hypothetical protein
MYISRPTIDPKSLHHFRKMTEPQLAPLGPRKQKQSTHLIENGDPLLEQKNKKAKASSTLKINVPEKKQNAKSAMPKSTLGVSHQHSPVEIGVVDNAKASTSCTTLKAKSAETKNNTPTVSSRCSSVEIQDVDDDDEASGPKKPQYCRYGILEKADNSDNDDKSEASREDDVNGDDNEAEVERGEFIVDKIKQLSKST